MKDFNKYSELIAKYLAGESNLSEKEELFSWTGADQENHSFFEEMERVWNMTEGADASPFEADMGSAWDKIDVATGGVSGIEQGSSTAKVIPLSKRKWQWGIAAAILLTLVAGLWWIVQVPDAPMLVEVHTQENEKKEILLPDGSQIWMNENSKIAYQEKFDIRKIALEGEAYFDVAHKDGAPFEITSGEATTTVLGTTFNVRAYPDEEEIEVTVETGRVALALASQPTAPLELPAGTSGVVHVEEKRVERVEEKFSNAISWKTMRLSFDEALIKDVIVTLERFFGTEIQVSNEMIFECTLSSTFDNPDLNEIMDVIGGSINADIQNENGAFLLIGEGCTPNN